MGRISTDTTQTQAIHDPRRIRAQAAAPALLSTPILAFFLTGLPGCASSPTPTAQTPPPTSTPISPDQRAELRRRPLPATLLYPDGPLIIRSTDRENQTHTRFVMTPAGSTTPNPGVWAVISQTPDGLVDTRLELFRTPEGAVTLVAMEIARDSEIDRYTFTPALTITPAQLPTTEPFTASAQVAVRGPGRSLDGSVHHELERIVDPEGRLTFRNDLLFDLGAARVSRNSTVVVNPDAEPGHAVLEEIREREVKAGLFTVSKRAEQLRTVFPIERVW